MVEEKQERKDDKESLVEAALFIAGRFLSLNELVKLTEINPITLREILGRLEEKYGCHPSLVIARQGESWKLDVRPEFAYLAAKLATGQSEFSEAEKATLALIAYKQPVRQSIVVKVRGNKAYEHIRTFLKAGLIKAKPAGHTLELSLSDRFHEHFRLEK